MPENGMPGPVCDLSSVRESVCIHTRKIFDSCRDKDCVEDLRFYPTASAMELLSGCQMVRGGTAELLYVYTDVEPVTFNRGFYSIDMRFFYRVTLQVGTGTPRCAGAEGLCVFDKRCILFGSEGSAKIFSSDTVIDELDIPGRMRTNLPTAVVEAVDPIVLDTRVDDGCKPRCCECGLTEIPAEKILMGMSNYGYDWALPFVRGESKAEKLTNYQAQARAEYYGVPVEWDETAQAPFYTYATPAGVKHIVWFENERSWQARLALVAEYGLAGISIWNIMHVFYGGL